MAKGGCLRVEDTLKSLREIPFETPLAPDFFVLTMADSCLERSDAASFGTCKWSLHSAFLQLPVELRDEIYSHVASSDPASSTITFSTQPSDTASRVSHGLLHACKQTRKEYTQALLRYSGITATIDNFDFQPFVAYIGQLPSTFLDLLPKQFTPLELTNSTINYVNPGARVHILVKITDDGVTALEGLRHWQIKQKSMEAARSRFRVDYRFTGRPDVQARLGMRAVLLPGLMDRFDRWDDAITQAELKGIVRALLQGIIYFTDAEEASGALYLLQTSGLDPNTTNEFMTAYRNLHANHTL